MYRRYCAEAIPSEAMQRRSLSSQGKLCMLLNMTALIMSTLVRQCSAEVTAVFTVKNSGIFLVFHTGQKLFMVL